MSAMLDRLQNEFGITDITECKPGLTSLKVAKDKTETLIRELRDREGYTHLNFMTCIDYIEDTIAIIVWIGTSVFILEPIWILNLSRALFVFIQGSIPIIVRVRDPVFILKSIVVLRQHWRPVIEIKNTIAIVVRIRHTVSILKAVLI